ncbi:hypothetical protein IWW50_006644, partial [Coemansia erecta]
GARARYYHPIPPRTILVEGAFMRQAVEVSWKRGDSQGAKIGRHMFGLDSQLTKSRWVQCLEAALKGSADMPSKDILRGAEKAAQALIPASGDQAKSGHSGKPDASGTVPRSAGDHSITSAQLLATLIQPGE